MAATSNSEATQFIDDEICVSLQDLADILKLTNHQQLILDTLWNIAFVDDWIYLSNEIIEEFLSDESGEHAARNYVKRYLKTICNEFTDYKQCERTHACVQKYRNEVFPDTFGEHGETLKPYGNIRKFYIATRFAFKKLLCARSYRACVAEHLERHYRDDMLNELEGEAEVQTPAGRIDIMTADEIIEVKEIHQWKAALGQILAYSFYHEGKTCRLHLFGEADGETVRTIDSVCEKYNVRVTYEL
jgi:hypothetical protein